MAGGVSLCLALLWICNAVDTAATLYYTQSGLMVEVNPIMAALLEYPTAFVCIKIGLVSAICILLWACRGRKLARFCVYFGAGLYGAVALYYAVMTALFVSGVIA